jgi:uncharacterized repeat protein (TIGR01451 family)
MFNLVVAFLVVCLFGLTGPEAVFAATTPSLGAAATYGVLSSTYTDTSGATTVNGDVGFTTPPATPIGGVHANYGSGAPYSTAGIDQGNALSALAVQPCTFTFGGGAINLSTDITHGPVGVYTPGVYCSSGAMSISGTLTLNGSGTYIFRSDGALTSVAGAIVVLSGGASACDVFWTPTQAITLGANTTFFGTAIDNAGITVGANTTWNGRALAFGGTVTTDTNTITVPTCIASAPSSSAGSSQSPAFGVITVIKIVINDNGGTKTISDFPLFVNGTSVSSGLSYVFPAPAGVYAVTEPADTGYARSFAGDCDGLGLMALNQNDYQVCIVTNNDIGAPVIIPPVPPLIDVVKVPNPLALPAGPGPVVYTYTLRNIGRVPVSNITMVGDTCSPITRVSGDLNNDNILDLNEVWVHRCTTTLTETHTNTIVATGWANGLSATDIASATVVVGLPIVPPLIHITKIPDPVTLYAGGGMVTYTKYVTNPGTVPLHNVRVIDNTCSPVTYVSGDVNNDTLLDPTEMWTYSCRMNLTGTVTNTAVAEGSANGLLARDFAIATVVVASVIPSLPNTGVGISAPWGISVFIGIIAVVSLSLLLLLKKRIT